MLKFIKQMIMHFPKKKKCLERNQIIRRYITILSYLIQRKSAHPGILENGLKLK